MTKITEDQLKLCRIQGDVFAESASRVPCSSPIFMRRFMYSQVAQRMDSGSFLFEACETDQILEEINREFGDTTYGKERYSVEELYWIGYLYRYWCCTYDRSSKQVYKLVKPKELRALYYPYHSLDPAQAIERILESKGIIGVDSIARGVAVMRAAIQRERKLHLQDLKRFNRY